jgi:hypothetical protein
MTFPGDDMTRSGGRCRLAVVAAGLALLGGGPARAWGPVGHALVTRAALAVSEGLPAWFRDAGPALVELANAPDRWRSEEDATPALRARAPDHFFDLDAWGSVSLPADRWDYVREAQALDIAPEKIGFLPYAMLEEYGALVSAFRDARSGRAGSQAGALVAAGTLAHLAGDAAVPLHVTRHHHGWVGPNPEGFTRRASIHHWFESDLIGAVPLGALHIGAEGQQTLADSAAAVRTMLGASLDRVRELYRLERDVQRTHDETRVRAFAVGRLAAGATFLAQLWHTAWKDSGG